MAVPVAFPMAMPMTVPMAVTVPPFPESAPGTYGNPASEGHQTQAGERIEVPAIAFCKLLPGKPYDNSQQQGRKDMP